MDLGAVLVPVVKGGGRPNAGGSVNCKAGFFGITVGGCIGVGVKPNCPAEKFAAPPLFVTLIKPSITCTYKPGGIEGGVPMLGATPAGKGILTCASSKGWMAKGAGISLRVVCIEISSAAVLASR